MEEMESLKGVAFMSKLKSLRESQGAGMLLLVFII